MTAQPRKRPEGVWVSPADRLISELPGTYYKLSEVAKILNVSPTTLRRLKNKPQFKAPSQMAEQGDMFMYLYTEDDLKELAAYFAAQKQPRKRV